MAGFGKQVSATVLYGVWEVQQVNDRIPEAMVWDDQVADFSRW